MDFKAPFLFFLLVAFAFPADIYGEKESLKNYPAQNSENLFRTERHLIQKLAKEPSNADHYLELSNVYASFYDSMRKTNPEEAALWLDKSKGALERAVMLRPEDIVARYNLGVVYKRQGKFEKSRGEFRKILEHRGSFGNQEMLPAVWIQIGNTYGEQGFFEDARDAYLKAREFYYDSPVIQDLLEDIKIKEQEFRERSAMDPSSLGLRPMPPASDYAEFGRLGQYDQGASGNIGEALPYLGMLLVQELVRKRGEGEPL